MDGHEGEVLPGAVVKVVEGQNAWTLTDTRGRFVLNLHEGPVKLEISYIGYETQVHEMVLDRNKDTLFLSYAVVLLS